jgi:hypothetical protein
MLSSVDIHSLQTEIDRDYMEARIIAKLSVPGKNYSGIAVGLREPVMQ